MEAREPILYQFEVSPYCVKIRKILAYKGVSCEIREADLLVRRELVRLSGQRKVPVLLIDDLALHDSTDIARYLEQRFPTPPIYPREKRLRALAFLIEDWADESLQRVVGPLKFLIPENCARMIEIFRSRYPRTLRTRLLLSLAPAVIQRQMRRFALDPRVSRLSALLESQIDDLSKILGERAFLLGGTHPTIADFAVFGVLAPFEGLQGYQIVAQHPQLQAWMERMKEIGAG